MSNKKLQITNEERNEVIRRRFVAGDTLKAIAADLGLTFGRVGHITRAMGLQRHSAPIVDKSMRGIPAARFWCKVNKDGPVPAHAPELGPCWIWIGATAGPPPHNYGNFQFGGKLERAHRVAFFFEFWRWPENCLHRCDNATCVRSSHLFEGTQHDNMLDMVAKGREGGFVGLKGEAHMRSKITDEDVRAIRAMRSDGEVYRVIAEQFDLSIAQVFRICTREHWSHVKLYQEPPPKTT